MLVRVHAAGCGPDVWHLMTGMPYMARLAIGLREPKASVRGWDVAGTVEAVGANVTGIQPGDEVMGTAKGSFAELVIARRRQADPEAGEPHLRAGGGPSDLRRHGPASHPRRGKVQPGQKVLVIGAAGGVGSLAVQIAKAVRREGHRRVQHLEDGPGPLDSARTT